VSLDIPDAVQPALSCSRQTNGAAASRSARRARDGHRANASDPAIRLAIAGQCPPRDSGATRECRAGMRPESSPDLAGFRAHRVSEIVKRRAARSFDPEGLRATVRAGAATVRRMSRTISAARQRRGYRASAAAADDIMARTGAPDLAVRRPTDIGALHAAFARRGKRP